MTSDETPYPNKDFTERERWAESEAQQFIKNAQALEESEKTWRMQIVHPENTIMMLKCQLEAATWRKAADSLRRPRIMRLEYNSDR